MSLAVNCAQCKRWDQLVQASEQIVRLYDEEQESYSHLAYAYLELDRDREAIEACKVALRIQPDFFPAVANLGISYLKLGMLSEAVSAFKQAIELNPGNAEVRLKLGETYAKQGDLPEAREQLRVLEEADPDAAKEPVQHRRRRIFGESANAGASISISSVIATLLQLSMLKFPKTGSVCFNSTGDPVFKYAEFAENTALPMIDDCYAMNVDHAGAVWINYYSDFSLVRLSNFELEQVSNAFGVLGKTFAVRDDQLIHIRKDQLATISLIEPLAPEPLLVLASNENGNVIVPTSQRYADIAARGTSLAINTGNAVYTMLD